MNDGASERVARTAEQPIPGLVGNPQEKLVKRRGWGFYASHIGPNGSYMHRYIFRTPWFQIRLHHILRSDEDRHLHDHPFNFVSFLLSSGYWEETPLIVNGLMGRQRRWCPRFSFVRRLAEDLHKLTLVEPTWTLVFAQLKRRDWGFQTEDGWVNNRLYHSTWDDPADA